MTSQQDLYDAINEAKENIFRTLDYTELVKRNESGLEIRKHIFPPDISNEIKQDVDNIISIALYIDQNFTAVHNCVTDYINKQKFPKSEEEFFDDYSQKVSEMAAKFDVIGGHIKEEDGDE